MTETNDNQTALVHAEPNVPMTARSVCEQIALIQEIMANTMKDKMHYGTIPGCGDKPVLLKPGAEKLILTFRMDPQVEVEVIDLPGDHREYRCKTTLYSISTQNRLGSGIGTCSTMERKYRYRLDNTNKEVPKNYWDTRDKELIGGKGFKTKKVEVKGRDVWMIMHEVEHDNPADYWNTCAKMAKKRSLVDAVLTVTAASDIFTQDIEEMQSLIGVEGNPPKDKPDTPKPRRSVPTPQTASVEPAPLPREAKEDNLDYGADPNGDTPPADADKEVELDDANEEGRLAPSACQTIMDVFTKLGISVGTLEKYVGVLFRDWTAKESDSLRALYIDQTKDEKKGKK